MTAETPLPFVTVIMPIRNEAHYIESSLKAVLAQDYPHHLLEVLISDGMSDDETRSLIHKISDQSDIVVKIIDNPKQIAASGFNVAAAQAKGQILIRVDGHCDIAPNYVSLCVKHLLENDVIGVGGPIETIGRDELSKIIAIAMSSPFGVGGSSFRTVQDKTMLVDTIAFPAYKREAIDAVGLLDEEFFRNEDDDYNYRLRAHGYKLLLASDVRSKYYSRSSLKSLWQQYYRYGLWKVRVLQKYPFQMRPRQFVPGALVFSLLLTGLLTLIVPLMGFLFLGIAGLYLVANVLASLVTVLRTNAGYIPMLSLVFMILHFSYGTGFLVGLVRFSNRWQTTPTTQN